MRSIVQVAIQDMQARWVEAIIMAAKEADSVSRFHTARGILLLGSTRTLASSIDW